MKDFPRELPVSALLVGEFAGQRDLLQDVFQRCGWDLHQAPDRRHALHTLQRSPVSVVITESDGACDWRKMLKDLRRLPAPPQLVVTSRLADDHLWAEVLNVGGFDVLAQPLNREEVERVVAAASRHCEPAHASAAVR